MIFLTKVTSSQNLHRPWFVNTVKLWIKDPNKKKKIYPDKGTVRFCFACFLLSFLEGRKNTKGNKPNQTEETNPNDHQDLWFCTHLAQGGWPVPQAVPSSPVSSACTGSVPPPCPASIRAPGKENPSAGVTYGQATSFPPLPSGTSRLQGLTWPADSCRSPTPGRPFPLPGGRQPGSAPARCSPDGERTVSPAASPSPAALRGAPAGCPGPPPASLLHPLPFL